MESVCRQQDKGWPNDEFVLPWVENIVGKGENAGYQHFLLFPQYFQKLIVRVSRIGIVW